MKYFTNKTKKFLADLEVNNNRDWFHENKNLYKEHVEVPFEGFITDCIEGLRGDYPNMTLTPKEAIFRIYRDVRFSKDKSPYKTHASAIISPGGRKNYAIPGIYIELQANQINIYAGVYEPDKTSLEKIRQHIAKNAKQFQSLIEDKNFLKSYGEIKGNKSKILPKELKEAASKQALIFNKAFYYQTSLVEKWISSESLLDEVMRCARIALPLNNFFAQAMKE